MKSSKTINEIKQTETEIISIYVSSSTYSDNNKYRNVSL